MTMVKTFISNALIFITFSFGGLPDTISAPNSVGGFFVVGLYKEEPKIAAKCNCVYLGMIEF